MKAWRLPLALLALALATMMNDTGNAAAAQVSIVGSPPAAATLEPTGLGGTAELAVTVRNDSRLRRAVRVRLILDTGAVVRLRKRRVDTIVESQRVTLALRRRGRGKRLRIGARDVRRIKVQLLAEPQPKTALNGTLVVGLANAPSVSPLTVRVSAGPETTASRFAKAKPTPASVVMVVRRWLPTPLAPHALLVDRQDVDIQGVGAGAAIAAGKQLAEQQVAADSGGRGNLVVTAPDAIAASDDSATIRIDAQRLTSYGSYDAEIPLDPTAGGSPAVKVKVITRDLFVWPLLALLLGTWFAYRQLRRQEEDRPREVLRLTLTKLKQLHEKDRKEAGPIPYELNVFPDGGDWNDCSNPELEAHALWCRIAEADLKEELDDLADEIADLDARVRGWPIARTKVARLASVRKELPPGKIAKAIRDASKKLESRKKAPADKAATNAYFGQPISTLRSRLRTILTSRRSARTTLSAGSVISRTQQMRPP